MGGLVGILSLLNLREFRMCCDQNIAGTRWCSYSANAKENSFIIWQQKSKLLYVVWLLRTLHIVKNFLKKVNCTLRRRLSMEDLWLILIFTTEGSPYCVDLVNGDKIVLWYAGPWSPKASHFTSRGAKGWKGLRKIIFLKCHPPPGGGTPLYGLYRYVRPQRIWFFGYFGHK